MTFGSDMQELAQELTEEFAGELGESTLYHMTGEVYDTETGENVPTFVAHIAYMPEEEIVDGSAVSKSRAYSGMPFEYMMSHRIITVAGEDIPVVPDSGDIVQPPGSTVGHEVVFVDKDMYGAAYVMHVMRKPADIPTVE